MKEVIKRALIGISISVAISQLITLIVSVCINDGNFYHYYPILEKKYGSALNAELVLAGCEVLLGIVFGTGTFIWNLEKWSLTRQTVVHFLIITVSCLLSGWCCYWYPHRISGVFIALGEYVVTYVIIWCCVYANYKKSVKQINDLKSE